MNLSLNSIFSNTLVNVYLTYSLISFLICLYFIIIPVNRLRIEWGLTLKSGKERVGILRQFLSELDSYKDNMKKVRHYLYRESILALLPLIIILIFRIVLEPGDIQNWNAKAYLYVLLLSFLIIWTLMDCISFKSSITPWLKKHQKWYNLDKSRNPEFIFPLLSLTSLSRKNLEYVSKIEVPEYIEDDGEELKAITKKSENDESKNELDKEALKENISILGSRIKTKVTNYGLRVKNLLKI